MTSNRNWTVGRAADCDVVVNHPTASSRHCRLSQTERGYVLEDLGSTNGTFVNGAKVNSPVRVGRGDRITLGMDVEMPWPEGAGALAGGENPALGVTFRSPSMVFG